MAYLLDSNVLVYMMNPSAPQHASALAIPSLLVLNLKNVFVTPQTLMEYYRTATRPVNADDERQGLGLTPSQAHQHVESFYYTFGFLPDTPVIFEEWLRIVQVHEVSGKNVHDARIVATMWAYGVNRLLTFNGKDFRRYPRIEIISPDDLQELVATEMGLNVEESPDKNHDPKGM